MDSLHPGRFGWGKTESFYILLRKQEKVLVPNYLSVPNKRSLYSLFLCGLTFSEISTLRELLC